MAVELLQNMGYRPLMSNEVYILLDSENVAPNINYLSKLGSNAHLLVFISDKKLPFHLVQTLQPFGSAVSYVRTARSGKNAMDFHIAYCLGKMANMVSRGSRVFIVSGDTGYDSLIQQISLENPFIIKRVGKFSRLPKDLFPSLEVQESEPEEEKPDVASTAPQPGTVMHAVDKAAKFLQSRGNARPKKMKGLINTILPKFAAYLDNDPEKAEAFIHTLAEEKVLSISATGAITYHFASAQ